MIETGRNEQKPGERNNISSETPANISERDMPMMECSKHPGLHEVDRESEGRDWDDDENRSNDEYPNIRSADNIVSFSTVFGFMSPVKISCGREFQRKL
jgi:hypothetical protein